LGRKSLARVAGLFSFPADANPPIGCAIHADNGGHLNFFAGEAWQEMTMRRYIPQLACMALAFSFSTAFAFAQNSNPAYPSQNSAASQQTQTSNQPSNFDRQFVEKAAKGNQAEIDLAKLAQEKATSPEVKSLAQMIEQDHQQAQEKLQTVAQGENVSMPSEAPPDAAKMKKKLSSMSGQDFDHTYVQYMVREHKKDIGEFQKAAKNASDPDVRQYATTTLPTLQKHLKMAEQAAGQEPSTQAHE
jgi:putative membrane protein